MRRARTYTLFRETKSKTLNIFASLILLAGSSGGLVPLLLSHKVSADAPNVINNLSTQGWTTDDTRPGGSVSLVADASAPLGNGALKLTTDSSTTAKAQFTTYFSPVALSSVSNSSLSYATKQNSSPFAGADPAYQLYVFVNGSSGFDTLTYEPYVNEGNSAIHQGDWQNWSVGSGKFYSSHDFTGPGGSIVTSQGSSTYTLDQIRTDFPSLNIIGMGVNIGSNNPSYDVEADAFAFNGTTYDFDVATPATPTNLRLSNPNGNFACGLFTNINNITPTWDAVADASSYNYEVTLPNGSMYGPVNVGNVTSVTGPFGAEGLSTFSVQAVNGSGVTSAWATPCAVTYDATAPTTPTLLSPGNGSVINTNDFYFTWTASSDASPVTYEFVASQNSHTSGGVLDTGVWDNIANGNSEQNHLTDPKIHSTGAPDGDWYWQVRAIDAAGNKSDWTGVWKVTIDTQAPAVPTNLSWKTSTNVTVPDGGYTNDATGTASWQDSSSDVDHYVYKYWNDIVGNPYKVGSEYVANVNGTSLPGVFNQGEGVHHFCVEAVDAAGNTSACSAAFTITYDQTAPDAPAITYPANNSHVANIQHVTWGAVTDNLSNPVTYIYQSSLSNITNGDGSFASPAYTSGSLSDTSIPTPGTPEGTYYLHVMAVDAAGNHSSWGPIVTVTVDNTAPTVTVDFLTSTDTTPTVTGTTSSSTDIVTVIVDGHSYSAAVASDGTWSATVTNPLAVGTYDVSATATDLAGNVGNDATTNELTITAVPPSGGTTVTTNNIQLTNTSTQVATTGNANNNGNTGGSDATTGDATNNNSAVLGASTTNTDPQVKGDSTVKLQTTADKHSNFLGLGWWWLLILVAITSFFWFILGRRSDADGKA